MSLWNAVHKIISDSVLNARSSNALQSFIHLIEQIKKDIFTLDLPQQIEHIIHNSGLHKYMSSDRSEKGISRIENLDEFVTATRQFAAEYIEEDNLTPMQSFLAHVSLEAGESQSGAQCADRSLGRGDAPA